MSLSLCKKIGTFVRQVNIMLLSYLTIQLDAEYNNIIMPCSVSSPARHITMRQVTRTYYRTDNLVETPPPHTYIITLFNFKKILICISKVAATGLSYHSIYYIQNGCSDTALAINFKLWIMATFIFAMRYNIYFWMSVASDAIRHWFSR